MNISRVDLNLLVYLDVLLRERNVTKAAEQLGITQPALSNGLKRLRDLLHDPLLVRTSEGMTPTEHALTLQPVIRAMISNAEKVVQPQHGFDAASSSRVFRIMASDYAESTLLPALLQRVGEQAPGIVLDVLTPSDVEFEDIEHGRVDMAVNRFDAIPQSFHQINIWRDTFSCLMSAANPLSKKLDLAAYLSARHIWVSKTGMGVGVGINPDQEQRLGWVDETLARHGKKRHISVFTRHYQVAALLARQNDLIATLPTRAARLHAADSALIIKQPPFDILPFELKMAWGPLLHHNQSHQWLRQQILAIARAL